RRTRGPEGGPAFEISVATWPNDTALRRCTQSRTRPRRHHRQPALRLTDRRDIGGGALGLPPAFPARGDGGGLRQPPRVDLVFGEHAAAWRRRISVSNPSLARHGPGWYWPCL